MTTATKSETPPAADKTQPIVQRDFVMLRNDVAGHRLILRQLKEQGETRVDFPIIWLDDLLTELEQLREASREMARVCGCLEPDENSNPACQPYCISCRITESFR